MPRIQVFNKLPCHFHRRIPSGRATINLQLAIEAILTSVFPPPEPAYFGKMESSRFLAEPSKTLRASRCRNSNGRQHKRALYLRHAAILGRPGLDRLGADVSVSLHELP